MKVQAPDPRLKATLQAFYEGWAAKREACFRGLDFEALRETLAEIKDDAIAKQDALLARFTERAEGHGSRVLRAADGDEANRLILDILKRHGAKTVVKSKSMVSEETRLNVFLAGRGVEPRETDLGEWIVQIAAEAPTHMVMPAIHLTRQGVARIFAGHLGREVPDDIPALVRVAREELRREILAAPAGLTGANALIAETGAVMIVTNEGNGRLVSTVPPVHIVLASTEKVLPDTADALLLLKILTKNATGQPISSYVSFIAGPHRGPQYIILLDNHRSELRADAKFRDVLRCIKCSACLNVCPAYQVVGGGAFSHVYMGGIGSLLTAWIHGLEASKELAELCLGCHRCDTVCSTKIPIGDLIAALKERLARETGKTVWKRLALDGVMGHPALERGAFMAGRAARPFIQKKGYARSLPSWMSRYDRFRALPAPAPRPLSTLFRRAKRKLAKVAAPVKGPVTLFPGCLVQHVYPRVGLAALRVLSRLGYDVVLGPTGCCGFPPWNSGHAAAARRAFRHVLKRMPAEGPVITLCPTCTTMLARAGPDLILGRLGAKARPEAEDGAGEGIRAFAGRVVTLSQFLARREREALRRLLPEGRPAPRVAYHDSCHHRHALKASEDSLDLLRMAIGTGLVEMAGSAGCCGFAGAYSVDHPEVAEALLAEKLEAVAASGAEVVALDCPGCLLQIRGGCRRSGRATEVRHTAEVLDAALARD
ncbi:MAG TPA: LUD domain-containing protein [Terriglobales bacterium]|nr:LUD domain-containing protein [Terriglobales bacterium]